MKGIIIYILVFVCFSCSSGRISSYEKEMKRFRNEYKKDFLKDERSPLSKKDLKCLDFFPVDTNFKVNAKYKLLRNTDTINLSTSAGKFKQYQPFALIYFNVSSIPCSLQVYRSMQLSEDSKYTNYLFLPFTDITSGNETYGGGRYIDLDKRNFLEDNIILDFNKAYNPWCAFGEGFNCPVPPKENELPVEIMAGEKKFKGKVHKTH